MPSAKQIRAARAHVGLTQHEVAERAGLEKAHISRIEGGLVTSPHHTTIERIKQVLELEGIKFTENDGIEATPTIVELTGSSGFRHFMSDVYHTVRVSTGHCEICVSNVDERNWHKWMGKDGYEDHASKMAALPRNFSFKIFIKEGDDFYIASEFAEYRHIPEKYFVDQSFYVYGNKLALITFSEDDVVVKITRDASHAESFRRLFNYAWDMTNGIA